MNYTDTPNNACMPIASFSAESYHPGWLVINDGVMGGMSRSKFTLDPGGFAVFEGSVSVENGGGFTMAKKALDKLSVQSYSKIVLNIKGDGRRYQLRVKSNRGQMHSYVCRFPTSGEWEEISIPFEDLCPAFRGRKLDLPCYPGDTLEEIGILIGNRCQEDFRLLLKEIRLA